MTKRETLVEGVASAGCGAILFGYPLAIIAILLTPPTGDVGVNFLILVLVVAVANWVNDTCTNLSRRGQVGVGVAIGVALSFGLLALVHHLLPDLLAEFPRVKSWKVARSHFDNYYSRWSQTPFFGREIEVTQGDGFRLTEGPLVNGQRHGEWLFIDTTTGQRDMRRRTYDHGVEVAPVWSAQ